MDFSTFCGKIRTFIHGYGVVDNRKREIVDETKRGRKRVTELLWLWYNVPVGSFLVFKNAACAK